MPEKINLKRFRAWYKNYIISIYSSYNTSIMIIYLVKSRFIIKVAKGVWNSIDIENMTYQGVVVITKCITPLKQKLTTLSWHDKILEEVKIDFYKLNSQVYTVEIFFIRLVYLNISKLLENEKRHLVGCCCCWTSIYDCVNFLKKIQ